MINAKNVIEVACHQVSPFRSPSRMRHVLLLLFCIISFAGSLEVTRYRASAEEPADQSADGTSVGATESEPSEPSEPQFEVTRLRGKVVWFAEALEKQLGIRSVPESGDRVLALQTETGDLLPLVEDLRGRAFRTDKRLREMKVELVVRRYRATPALQILRVHEVTDDGQLFQIDYWCDICSITMYEDGPCACCQDHNRLRRRPIKP